MFDISASIGVCAITQASESLIAVLGNADAACYIAKNKGRNRVQLFGGK
jgi:GGDEF domain-containing protein